MNKSTFNTLNYKKDNSLFSNNFGFMRFPLYFSPYHIDADLVITGVPFDITTSGRSGSRQGPNAIRQISNNLTWEKKRWPWLFNLNDFLKIIDCGDLVFNLTEPQDMSDKLQNHIEKLLISGKKCLTFGGDHFITLPLLRAHAKFFGKMSLIHFDAHTDTYNDGIYFDHGSMFYHAVNEDLIDPNYSIQIGIRTEYNNNNFKVLDASYINRETIDNIISNIKSKIGSLPIYLTFDIDCLDPAFAPGTGTPVIGGLTTDYVLKILRKLKNLNIIGMDIVEVLPAYDSSQITALAAATIALDMLYIQAFKKIK